MRIDFFIIPVQAGEAAAEELNRLLSSARILTMDRQFVPDGASSFWSICVVSQTGSRRKQAGGKRSSIDYREVLSAEDFAIYARLRELRKELANREGAPVYAVFTNEQLAEIARRRVSSAAALGEIEGLGEARVEKYGMPVVTLMKAVLAAPEGAGDAT